MSRFYFVFFSIFLICCNDERSREKSSPNSQVNPQGFEDSVNRNLFEISYIIFGKYCGNCPKNCATIYIYSMMGNANTLHRHVGDQFFSDTVDFSRPGQISERIDNNAIYSLAGDVYRQIPKQLLFTQKTIEKFGCPDCYDQCGLYFEFKQGRTTKKFRIDASLESLEGEVKEFATYLDSTIEKMNGMKAR